MTVIPFRKPIQEIEAPALVPPACPLLDFAVETIREQTRLTNKATDELRRYLEWVRRS